MRLEFVAPDLRRIDDLGAELLACAVTSDERPLSGLAGLVDFRMRGRLSALARRQTLTGERGERVLVPGRPRLPFDKVVTIGVGPSDALEVESFARLLDTLVDALFGLGVKRAVIELVARERHGVPPERAAELLFERVRDMKQLETLWLVEEPPAERTMRARVDEELRRIRLAAIAAEENVA